MSRLKRRVFLSALLAFTVWPLAQIGLVARYDANPWKLAGWGMYSVPQFPAEVRILCHTPDEVGTYELRSIAPTLEPSHLEFLRRRLGLGRLARPTKLAHALLDYYPAIDGVTIVVLQPVLNRSTGMVEEESTPYEYSR